MLLFSSAYSLTSTQIKKIAANHFKTIYTYTILFRGRDIVRKKMSKLKAITERRGRLMELRFFVTTLGNLLKTRKREVWILTRESEEKVEMEETELHTGLEIEQKIVERVKNFHAKFQEKENATN